MEASFSVKSSPLKQCFTNWESESANSTARAKRESFSSRYCLKQACIWSLTTKTSWIPLKNPNITLTWSFRCSKVWNVILGFLLPQNETSSFNNVFSLKWALVLSRSEGCPTFLMLILHHDGFNVIKSAWLLLKLFDALCLFSQEESGKLVRFIDVENKCAAFCCLHFSL